MSDLKNKANSVNDQSSLAEFVRELADEFTRNPDGWQNGDLESFLRSMPSWINGIDGYYENTGQSYNEKNVSWNIFADILFASTMYE